MLAFVGGQTSRAAPSGVSSARPPVVAHPFVGALGPPAASAPAFPAYAVTALAGISALRVYATPGGAMTYLMANPQPSGAPLTFLLDRQTEGWLRVFLPVRPDGSEGWVPVGDVALTGLPYRLDVHRAAHRLDLFAFGQLLRSFPVGIGTAETPTPGGTYYLKELLRPLDPNGAYGPYAFGLSGFSNVLSSFDGGDGVIGLHGTDEPAAIGHDVSHGCIRLYNADIAYLARTLPLGTPVRILT